MTHFTTLAEAGDRAEGGQTMTPDLIHELEARFRDVGRAPVTFGRLTSQAAPKAADIKLVAAADDNSELRAAIEPVDGMKGRLDAADLEAPPLRNERKVIITINHKTEIHHDRPESEDSSD
jgi:hypothetical protein